MAIFPGLFQGALQTGLQVARALLDPGVLVDEAGEPLACDVRADFAEKAIAPTVCHVGIDRGGTLCLTKGVGVTGLDDAGQVVVHAITAPDSAVAFGFYTPLEPQRRYLADWFIWNLVSGFSLVNGVRIDAYYLESLRNAGVLPQMERLFETEYAAPNLADDRPFGLAFRATVRLRCTLLATWSTPVVSPAGGVLDLAPDDAPANVGPPTSIIFS